MENEKASLFLVFSCAVSFWILPWTLWKLTEILSLIIFLQRVVVLAVNVLG